MTPSMHRQRGISFTSILFIAVVFGFVLTVGLKLGPYYMEFGSVRASMNDLARNPESGRFTKSQALRRIEDQLYINDVRSVDAKGFVYKQTREGYDLSVEYEVTEQLMGNVSALLTFTHKVSVPRGQ